MLLNEFMFLQISTFVFAFYSLSSLSLLNLWYTAGLFLITLSIYFLSFCGDIFIGFLLIAEFAVALVLYIFMIQMTFFSNQKNYWAFSFKHVLVFFVLFLIFFLVYVFLSSPNKLYLLNSSENSWLFLVSWYDFYELYNSYYLTDLLGIRELYFSETSSSFIVLNFVVLFYVLSCIFLSFSHLKFFTLMSTPWLLDFNTLKLTKTSQIIRTQNYIKQQEASTGTRVLEKSSYKSFLKSASKKN